MNILITGSCGHIGTYFARNIYKIKGINKTYLIDNLKTTQINSIFNSDSKNNLKFFNEDLTNYKSFENLKKVDFIIHLASMTNAEGSFDKKKEMYSNNIKCLKNVIKYSIKNKCKIIHISSTSVYGKQVEIVDENCEEKYLKPQSPYADIKLIEEKLLKKYSKKIKYVTYRFGTIAGISTGMRFHTAVNKFCLNASLEKPITVYKTALNQYRPYLSLKDAFKLVKFTIENNFFKNDIYNALSENCTVNQILNRIRLYKKKIKVEFVKTKIMNQLSYKVSQKKLNDSGIKLNSNITFDIKQTIQILRYL